TAVCKYPGVAEELKLSEEQTKQLASGGDAAKVLSPDQQTQAKTLLGEPYKGVLVLGPLPTGTGKGTFGKKVATPAAPADLQFAQYPDVQADLKVTPAQQKQIDEVANQRVAALKDYAGLSVAERKEKLAAVNQDVAKGLAAALTA